MTGETILVVDDEGKVDLILYHNLHR